MNNTAQWILTAAALVGAVGYLLSKARIAARKLDKLDELLAKLDDLDELLGTVKTDVPGMAVSIGHLQRQFDSLQRGLEGDRRRLTRLVILGARHHPDAAHEYLEEDK